MRPTTASACLSVCLSVCPFVNSLAKRENKNIVFVPVKQQPAGRPAVRRVAVLQNKYTTFKFTFVFLVAAGGFVATVVAVVLILQLCCPVAESERERQREREPHMCTCVFRERERERRKMTTLERAESCSAHTLAGVPSATSHSVLDVATKNKRLGAEDALQRRGRSGGRPPDGAAKPPRPSGDRGLTECARESEQRQPESAAEKRALERESSELNLIFFSARGETEVSLSLPATQLSAAFACRCPLSRSLSITLSLSLAFPFLFKSVSLSLSLLFRPSVRAPVWLRRATSCKLLFRPRPAANPTRKL